MPSSVLPPRIGSLVPCPSQDANHHVNPSEIRPSALPQTTSPSTLDARHSNPPSSTTDEGTQTEVAWGPLDLPSSMRVKIEEMRRDLDGLNDTICHLRGRQDAEHMTIQRLETRCSRKASPRI